MAFGKEIRTKIASIRSTQKITSAMQMIAASKMRKAQDRMRAARPFAEKIRSVVGHIQIADPEDQHPFLIERPARGVGVIVISTDRGLCGGLNINLFKQTISLVREWQAKNAELKLCTIGAKALAFFRRVKIPLAASETQLGDRPHLTDLIGPITAMVDLYREGKIDRLFLQHNQFINSMSQKPVTLQLLPVLPVPSDELQSMWEYIYEPSAEELLEIFLMRYIEAQVYRGAVENVACEMAARIVAMKAATDNAGKLIEELQLIYNKARQASITKEISEIVGGAAAV
jgi:F-type H+-transporting ATPase subunit gamma